MPFYKFVLNAGHFGAGHRQDIAVYIYAKSFLEARKGALNFPAIKRGSPRAIINSTIVDEAEFVTGILRNGYSKVMYDAQDLATLKQNARTLSYIKNYKFTTDYGKRLKDFCDRYNSANSKQQNLLEKEYNTWAQGIIDMQDANWGV